MKRLLVPVLLLAAVGAASAQVTSTPKGYLFRINMTPGKTLRYDTQVNAANAGATMKIRIPMAQTFGKFSGGTAPLTMKIGPILFNGQPMGQKPTVQTIRVDRSGKAKGGSAGSVTILPATPVRVGQKWTSAIPLAGLGATGATSATATYRFDGVKTFNGKPAAKLFVVISGKGQTKIAGDGVTWLSVTDGLPILTTMNLKVSGLAAGQGGAPQSVPMNVVVKRIGG